MNSFTAIKEFLIKEKPNNSDQPSESGAETWMKEDLNTSCYQHDSGSDIFIKEEPRNSYDPHEYGSGQLFGVNIKNEEGLVLGDEDPTRHSLSTDTEQEGQYDDNNREFTNLASTSTIHDHCNTTSSKLPEPSNGYSLKYNNKIETEVSGFQIIANDKAKNCEKYRFFCHQCNHSSARKEQKRERSSNFTRWERSLLVKLANENVATLENKKTDQATNISKMKCWEKIAEAFNSANSGPIRTPKVLKAKYDGIKKELRKHRASSSWRTAGGGPKEPSPPPITEEEKLLRENISLLCEGLKPLSNADSDSGCLTGASSSRITQESCYQQEEILMEYDKVTPVTLQTKKAVELCIPVLDSTSKTFDDHITAVEEPGTSFPEPLTAKAVETDEKTNLWKVPGRRERRRPGVQKLHSRSSASAKYESLAVEKLRLAKKKELLLDLQIDLHKKQNLYYDLKIAEMKKNYPRSNDTNPL